MAEKMTSINPSILIWAREASGISLKEVSEKFGKDKIENWEKGADYPTYNQLQQLCDFYRKPIAICFFPEPPVIKNLTTSFRTIPSNIEKIMFNRKSTALIDEARIMQINLRELNSNENIPYLHFASIKFSNDVNIMAQRLRKVFQADLNQQKSIRDSREHFEFWREKFIRIGIYVFKSPFRDNDISGFCLYDTIFPVIYINNSLSFTRQLFTLFHELCHIIYKTSGIDILNDKLYHSALSQQELDIEVKCNAFAGAFLVPSDDFIRQTGNQKPSEEVVSNLANSYGVSREVVLRKFLDSNRITAAEYQKRSLQYTEDYFRNRKDDDDKKSKGGNYYNSQASYKGVKYTQLVFQKYYTNQITLAQAANYMNMKIPSLRAFAEKKGWGTL